MVPTPAKSQDDDAATKSTTSQLRSRCAAHELVAIIGDRWSMLILIELADHGETRSNELRRAIDGISQKVMTSSLRRLEYRGFISRSVEATVPVSVRYDLTSFGHSFFGAFAPLRQWADDHVEQLEPPRLTGSPTGDQPNRYRCELPN